jgi:DtxR family Mn-dependent transcriptional regulator
VLAEQQVTDVVEEYLETIYRLQEKEGDVAKTNDIVRSMNVVPGTVTNTIERLEKEGLVTHEPYRGVKLTEKGQRIAIQVVRRHRLSERLLTDILHVDWGKAHDVACKIEHDIDDEEILANLEKALGNPKTCPHGNPIPQKKDDLILEERGRKGFSLLVNLDPAEGGIVTSVREEDTDILRYLWELGLIPGASVEIVGKEAVDHLIKVRVGGSHILTISEKVASAIYVRPEGSITKHLERPTVDVRRKLTRSPPFGEYEG